MRKRFVRRPSPAMIVALVALCLGAGGSAVAAKLKLSKNAVKTKNIKNGAVTKDKIGSAAVTKDKIADGAVTDAKIAAGAVGAAKLGGSAKASWMETNTGGTAITRQSGGIAMTPDGTGQNVVDFGVNIGNRAVVVTPTITLGEITAQYGRCTDIGCPPAFDDSTTAIEVFTFDAATNGLATSGFTVALLP
jgi:Rieske Fe-S protein